MRLETIQRISKVIYSRPIINRDVFYGGSTEGVNIKYNITYKATLFDLLKNYSNILKSKTNISSLTIPTSELYSVDQAIKRITDMFKIINEWTNFINLIPKFANNDIVNKSFISSHFVATLELAKNGLIEMKQAQNFDNIFIKYKSQ